MTSHSHDVTAKPRADASIGEAVDRVVGVALTDADRRLLRSAGFAHLATVDADGAPASTVVWIDAEESGDLVLFNTAEGRAKARHVRREPRVAISVTAPDNPYQELSIQGEVIEITSDGADAHIDRLAQRYLGQERYPYRAHGERRLLVKIRPRRLHRNGY